MAARGAQPTEHCSQNYPTADVVLKPQWRRTKCSGRPRRGLAFPPPAVAQVPNMHCSGSDFDFEPAGKSGGGHQDCAQPREAVDCGRHDSWEPTHSPCSAYNALQQLCTKQHAATVTQTQCDGWRCWIVRQLLQQQRWLAAQARRHPCPTSHTAVFAWGGNLLEPAVAAAHF